MHRVQPCVSAGSWPTFKGDNARTGRGEALDLPITLAWTARLKGSLYSSPAVQNDLVVLGTSVGLVYGLDLKSGTRRWTTSLPDRVWGSAPALTGDRAYIGCVDGCVHALALADGSARGTYCSRHRGWFVGNDVLSAVLVEGSRIIFGSDDHWIYAMDAAGGLDWKVCTGGKLHDNGASEEAGLVVMASRDSKVYGLALADGAVRWTTKGGGAFNTVAALDAERAYLGCADGRLYALSLSDGALAWVYDTGDGKGIMSSPALGPDGSLVFGSSDGSVYCLAASTGTLRWVFHTGGYVLASPLITGKLVWIGSYDDRFYVLDLGTGKRRWSMRLDGGIYTAPADSRGRVLVAGRDGTLVCLRASEP